MGVGVVHHTPVKSRDLGVDMEAIRLSRQDNPYLQVGATGRARCAILGVRGIESGTVKDSWIIITLGTGMSQLPYGGSVTGKETGRIS